MTFSYPDLEPDDWTDVIKLYTVDGLTIRQIAKLKKFPDNRISDGLKVRGVDIRHAGHSGRVKAIVRPNYKEVNAVRAYRNGMPFKVIQSLYQIETIQQIRAAARKVDAHELS